MQPLTQRRIESAAVLFGKNSYNSHEANTMFAHRTADFDINYTISGSYAYNIAGNTYVCPPHSMILIPPGCLFSGYASERSTHIFCHFSLIDSSGSALSFTYAHPVLPPQASAALLAFADMYKRYSIDSDAYALPLGLICKLLLAELLHAQKSTPSSQAQNRSIPEDILNASNYVTAHLSSPISAAELAAASNMNSVYFSRRFQKYIGMTPSRYITQIKIEYAQKKLLTSDISVKALSDELGFPDPFTFSKKFKAVCGVSPSEFRKLNI